MNKERINQLADLSANIYQYIAEDSFLNQDYKSLEILNNTMKNLNERRFVVSVIAAMKAGKSTTFNAFLGRDLLPNETDACTTAITEIKHSIEPVNIIQKVFKNGEVEIIKETGEASLEENFHKDVRKTRINNEVSKIEKYYLESPIKSLEDSEYGELVQNFILVDTPGPNEARVEDFDVSELQKVALSQLKYSDSLIMLLDYQTYKSETNANILKSIFENREDLEEDQQKVVFLINKIDAMTEKDGSVDEVIEKVKSLIKTYAPVIKNPLVFAFSAKQANLARAVLNGTASEVMKNEMKLNYGYKFQKEIVHEGMTYSVIPEPEHFAEELMKMSNITSVEKSIIDKMFHQSSGKMIHNAEERIRQVSQNIIIAVEAQIQISSEDEADLVNGVTENKKKIDSLRKEGESLKAFAKDNLNELKANAQNILTKLPAELEALIEKHIGDVDILESKDMESLRRQTKEIQTSIIEKVQMKINQENDKIQRLVMNKQIDINSGLNQKFYTLSDKANEIIGKRYAIQFQTFNMQDIAVKKSNFTLNNEPTIQTKNNQHSSEDGFDRILKKTLSAAGAGLGAGIILPGIGNIAGAVVGGIAGLLNALLSEEEMNEKQVYKFNLKEMKNTISKQVKSNTNKIIKDIQNSLDQASKDYLMFIERQMELFITNLKGQLDLIIKEYQKNKGNIEHHVAHMKGIKEKIYSFLEEDEKLFTSEKEAVLI